MTKEYVKVVQTALWAALVLVQMAVVDVLEVRAETVRREVTYEAVEEEAVLPDEITVSVLAGNDEELVECQAVEWVEEAAYWQDDFSFPLTFYEYGAGTYQLGEIIVQDADLENPAQLLDLAKQYGMELLQSIGLSPDEYEVTNLVWAGAPYENEDGILCRDAEGQGRRLLRDYRVVYEGFVDPERWNELRRGGIREEEFEQQAEETDMEETEASKPETEAETVQVEEAEGEPEHRKSKLQELLEKITRILLVAVGIRAVFFLGGLFVLALLWTYRKLRAWFRNRR